MDEQKIKEFAQKHGFDDVKMIGEYEGNIVFQPVFFDKKVRIIGFPRYILQKENELSLKLDDDFVLTDHFFPPD